MIHTTHLLLVLAVVVGQLSTMYVTKDDMKSRRSSLESFLSELRNEAALSGRMRFGKRTAMLADYRDFPRQLKYDNYLDYYL
ncbi:unnamed protein product [Soboliphyme baturini]|uniref:Short neuropeptide F n=1 Tax=Soboliphyme baturini TaxID=241478 RepID=A0A183IY97_9BILA|nr:unnamed protein product [Soboliphyme baturini]